MEAGWSAAWNPSEPIELLFDRLEDCYVLSVAAKPAYTKKQMIDKALTAMQHTWLYPTNILEYQAFPTENKNWAEFKNHFAEAYIIRLQSGKSWGNPYHGAANAYENNDNDIITTLQSTLYNLTHASNANTNELNKDVLQPKTGCSLHSLVCIKISF